MIKDSDQNDLSFGDFLMNPKNLQTRKKEFFQHVNKVINWRPVVYRIEKLYNQETGRPGFPAIVMFKALLLSQWYGLSDPELEDCLKDRISFKQFVGLAIEDDVPDETTICRFRNRLGEKKLLEKLFKIINKQLEEKGLFVKQGTLIDASILNAEGGSKSEEKRQDKEATWVKKRNKSFYGFKIHAAMDWKSQLIHSIGYSTASLHDSRVWDELLHGEERAVFADKAYIDDGYKRAVRKQGIFWGILDKAKKGQKLSKTQKKTNKKKTGVRNPIERFFAVIKDQYKNTKVRYLGLKKNREQAFAMGIAYNLDQAVRLCYAQA
jgi:transposase, IS5 family